MNAELGIAGMGAHRSPSRPQAVSRGGAPLPIGFGSISLWERDKRVRVNKSMKRMRLNLPLKFIIHLPALPLRQAGHSSLPYPGGVQVFPLNINVLQ